MASASTSDVDPTSPAPQVSETMVPPASAEYAASEPSDIVALMSPGVTLELNGVRRTLPLPWSGELVLEPSESCQIVVSGPAATRVRLRIETSDLDRKPSLREEIAALTALRIKEALIVTGGNQTHAARLIGMPLRTFVSRLKALKISSDDPE